MKRILTGSQTVGPYYHIGLDAMILTDLAARATMGQAITISGTIRDGDGAAIPDALIEVWQANSEGRYDHPEDRQNKKLDPGFKGFGRIPTDAQGGFSFRTVKPGPVPSPDGAPQAPHLNVTLFMRGQLMHLITRLYFEGEPANQSDPVLTLVPAERRATLIARRAGERAYRWDVVMQGPRETVFFDC